MEYRQCLLTVEAFEGRKLLSGCLFWGGLSHGAALF